MVYVCGLLWVDGICIVVVPVAQVGNVFCGHSGPVAELRVLQNQLVWENSVCWFSVSRTDGDKCDPIRTSLSVVRYAATTDLNPIPSYMLAI